MRNDFIQHGIAWKNHKYVAKTKLASGKWFYWYDMGQYQNWLKRQGQQAEGKNALADPKEKERTLMEKTSTQSIKPEDIINKNTSTTKGATLQQKTQEMNNNIAVGQKKIEGLLASNYITSTKDQQTNTEEAPKTEEASKKAEATAQKSKESSSSSKKSKSGGSSKKSSTPKAKPAKSGKSSKEKKEKEAKGKSSGGGKGSASKESKQKKEEKEKLTDFEQVKKGLASIGKQAQTYSSSEIKNKMLSKYKDGSFGYLNIGGTVYSWEISGGNITLKDSKSGKEVSFDEYVKKAKEIEEIQSGNRNNNKTLKIRR